MGSGRQSPPPSGVDRHRQAFFRSLAGRSSPRRHSIIRPSVPSPTCEESIHYPVFNPRDPRHNPTLAGSSWSQTDDSSQPSPSSPKSLNWMQGLPRKSLRKARSSLFILKSGLHKRPSIPDSKSKENLPRIWSATKIPKRHNKEQECDYPDTVSDASTEDDPEFGAELYRTACNYSSLKWDADEYLLEIPSSLPFADSSRLTRLDVAPRFCARLIPGPIARKSSDEHPALVSTLCRTESKEHTIKWHDGYVSKTCQNIEALDRTVRGSAPDSPRSTAPQIEEIKLDVRPLRLFDRSSSGSSPSLRLHGRGPTDPVQRSIHSPASYPGDTPTALKNATETKRKEARCQTPEARELPSTEEDGGSGEPQDDNPASGLPPTLDPLDQMESQDTGSHCSDRGGDSFGSSPGLEPLDCRTDEGTLTGPTSPISNMWSPVDDDLTSIFSFKDEFFLVDGKSSNYRPDPGDNATKTGKRLVSDGSIHSGPGLDRVSTRTTQIVPEIIGPGGHLQAPTSWPDARVRMDRNTSDSTDDNMTTYHMMQQRFH